MSTTPRTDEAQLQWEHAQGTPPSVSAHFARLLETDLARATELLREAHTSIGIHSFHSPRDRELLNRIARFLVAQPAPKKEN